MRSIAEEVVESQEEQEKLEQKDSEHIDYEISPSDNIYFHTICLALAKFSEFMDSIWTSKF